MESNKKKKRRERRAEVYNLSVVIAFIAFCCGLVISIISLEVAIYFLIVFGIAGFIAIFFHDDPEGWDDVHWPRGAA